MKVLSVVGNRPQFIKSAPLSLALAERGVDEVILHTGQHYDQVMSDVFFGELGLVEPRYRLSAGGLARKEMLATMQDEVEAVVAADRPDWILVYGDTNSTLAGARAARARGVPLAHVEAGLRSGDWSMPEERNRVETDRIADLLLCPDQDSVQNLVDEGVGGRREVTGDVMYDAALTLAPIARKRSTIVADLGLEPGGYALATIHREANVERPRLERIVAGLGLVAETVIFPVHPRTRAAIAAHGVETAPHVRLIDAVGYLDMTALLAGARVAITDSGGLQKEAYWHGVPCVTARPSTEWTATVEAGANVLVDDDPEALASTVAAARPLPPGRPPLYGDGAASRRIAELLAEAGPVVPRAAGGAGEARSARGA